MDISVKNIISLYGEPLKKHSIDTEHIVLEYKNRIVDVMKDKNTGLVIVENTQKYKAFFS